MSSSLPLRRIVTCQGSIQLITAFSVMAYREKVEGISINDYENYLVIYHLYAPAEQIDDFINLIKQIANSLCDWKSIVYIPAENLTNIAAKLHYTGNSAIFSTIHNLVGTNTASEIYLSRNWQFGNELLINTYKSAYKICYGDSIGLYFSSNSSAFFAKQEVLTVSWNQKLLHFLVSLPKELIRHRLNQVQETLGLKTILKTIEFDSGYFALPDVMGEMPSMSYEKINIRYLLATFHALIDLVDADYVNQLKTEIADAPLAVLLTSNFSEAGRMSCEQELSAYVQFLSSAHLTTNTVLIIKPHPRDDLQKIEQLRSQLSELFSQVIILSQPELFFLPFEVFFLKSFMSSEVVPPSTFPFIQVFGVSSACLSLKLLFHVPSVVGFGENITPKTFYQDYIQGRLEHERDLNKALQIIDSMSQVV
jgi:hypothetical protein